MTICQGVAGAASQDSITGLQKGCPDSLSLRSLPDRHTTQTDCAILLEEPNGLNELCTPVSTQDFVARENTPP